MQISVSITNLTPFFSAAPLKATIGLDGSVNPPGGGFPYTRTRTARVAVESEDGVKAESVPVIPSNTMRNLLRRSILKNVLEPVLAGRVQLSISAYAAAYSGNATGNPSGVTSPFDDILEIRNHPFLGLFGGGPRMMEGRLMVDTLYPAHQHVDAAGLLGDGHENSLAKGTITDTIWTRRVDPVAKLKDEDDAGVIEGGKDAANEWIQAWHLDLNEEKKAKAASRNNDKSSAGSERDESDKNRGLNAFNAHEVVIPGIRWVWQISADKPTDAQIGLVLAGLAQLPKLRIAGGHSKGYGSFRIDEIRLEENVVFSGGSFDEEQVERFMEAMSDELDSMTGESFERFVEEKKPVKQEA